MKKIVVALLVLAAVFGMTSCNMIMGIFKPYLGTWECIDKVDKDILTLTQDTFELSFQTKEDNLWVNTAATKGSLEVDGGTAKLTFIYQREADESGNWNEWEKMPEEEKESFAWAVEGDTLTLTDVEGGEIVFTWVGY